VYHVITFVAISGPS